MDNKQKVEAVLKQTPDIAFDELKNKVPGVDEAVMKSVFDEFQQGEKAGAETTESASKTQKTAAAKTSKSSRQTKNSAQSTRKSKTGKSSKQTQTAESGATAKTVKRSRRNSKRQKVIDFLEQNVDTPLKKLQEIFPDIHQPTLNSYFYKWRNEKSGQAPKPRKQTAAKQRPRKGRQNSLSTNVHEFLNKNPQAAIRELREAFSDANQSTLSALLSKWRKAQELSTSRKKTKKADTAVKADKRIQNETAELIKALKMTIAAQEKTIDSMKKTIEMLAPMSSTSEDPEELRELNLSEIKRVAATYIKSIRDLPTKLKAK